jgi:hypothetical protein
MGRFHDELTNTRRNGTAPGMSREEAPEPARPSFGLLPEGVPLLNCHRCGVVVSADRSTQHADWHVLLND